jgi:hypothetical protein
MSCDVCLETLVKVLKAERRKLTIIKSTTSLFTLLLFSIIIGLSGGAGSVFIQGKDNLELPRGTELTIRSSGPR